MCGDCTRKTSVAVNMLDYIPGCDIYIVINFCSKNTFGFCHHTEHGKGLGPLPKRQNSTGASKRETFSL